MPNKYYNLAKKELFLINRSITGNGIKKTLNEKDYLYYKNLLRKPRNQISTSSFRNSSSTPTSWHNSVKKINILH